MRLVAIGGFLIAIAALLVGCGDSGGGTQTAAVSGSSGGAPPPPPGGGAPAPPAYDSGAEGGMPAETPPSDGANPGGDMPTPDGATPAEGTPGEGMPASPDGASPDGTGEMNPDGTPRVRRVKTYQDLMNDALAAGHEEEWLRMVRTNFIANPASWQDGLLKSMGWIPALRRPALGPRFGVIAYYGNAGTLPKDFDWEASPQPIGSAELKTAMATFGQGSERSEKSSRKNRGQAQATEAPVASEPVMSPEEERTAGAGRGQLIHHTGEFGTKFVDQLKARIEAGEYGAIYKEAAAVQASRKKNENDPSEPYGGEMPATDSGAESPPGDGPAPEKKTADQPPRLGMGIVWLGRANSKEELEKLLEAARVDLVVIYDIRLRPAKTGTFVDNITKLIVSSPKAKKEEAPLFTSAALENRVVMQAREKTQKEDSVDKEVQRAIEALDKVCKPTEMPAGVTSDAVKRRLSGLIAEKPADPLPVLLEARFFACKNLLTEEEVTAAGVALLGEAEYARLIATFPGTGASAALSMPSILNVLHGVSALSGAAGPQLAQGGPPGQGGQNGPARKGRSKARPAN